MYVYQNGKLYRQNGEILVGVEIYPDHVLLIEGTETKLAEDYVLYSHYEVRCKFHIDTRPYIFPQEKKEEVKVEVAKNEPVKSVRKTKATPRKSTSK